MMTDRAHDDPAGRYVAALGDLRAARQRYVDAKVPMDPVRRRPQDWMSTQEPPQWTREQIAAVLAYAHAWQMLVTVYESYRDASRTGSEPE